MQQNKRELGPANLSQQTPRKGGPNSLNKGQSKERQPPDNQPKLSAKKGTRKSKGESGVSS